MTDQANAFRLANEAFDLWQAGHHEQAVKHAPTADKAEELRERLKEVFGGAG